MCNTSAMANTKPFDRCDTEKKSGVATIAFGEEEHPETSAEDGYE